jgi:hypothetical protein
MKLMFLPVAPAVVALAVACGGDASPDEHKGAATAAVAAFFTQENDGGLLPEGVGKVTSGGIRAEDAHRLEISADQKDADIKSRYCVEYAYNAQGGVSKRRVYLAQLVGNNWRVETVSPDGTCEGVA